jgi:hypothetical protein
VAAVASGSRRACGHATDRARASERAVARGTVQRCVGACSHGTRGQGGQWDSQPAAAGGGVEGSSLSRRQAGQVTVWARERSIRGDDEEARRPARDTRTAGRQTDRPRRRQTVDAYCTVGGSCERSGLAARAEREAEEGKRLPEDTTTASSLSWGTRLRLPPIATARRATRDTCCDRPVAVVRLRVRRW